MVYNVDSCPPAPCWQHYSPQPPAVAPVKWVIELARSLLVLRVRALSQNPSIEEVQGVQEAARLLASLLGAQWRNCVRQPFNFPSKAKVGENFAESQVALGLSLEDL